MADPQAAYAARLGDLVAAIPCGDAADRALRDDVLGWIGSGAALCRAGGADIPPRHLICYFVPVDRARRAVLLGDHIRAGVWLPPGGHVEPGEDPADTVRRETLEELGIPAALISDRPLMLSQVHTRTATGGHLDVALWYALALDTDAAITPDPGEYHAVRWVGFDDPLTGESDPHLRRFLARLG